jgi:hypothetical protein
MRNDHDGAAMTFPYELAGPYADIVHALGITETNEKTCPTCGQFIPGDGGQARGLLQIHPARFKDVYGCSAGFLPDLTDTWIQADIKACAAYLDKWAQVALDLRIQGWRLGIQGVLGEGQRDPKYLQRFNDALNKVKGLK